VSRLNEANVVYAKEIIGRYPKARSATIPLLHLAQQQDGYVTNEAMKHIGELVGATSAEILGTATFYEMFKFEPVGKYVINICSTMSCALLGADELMHHAEQQLGIKAGSTTPDGCSPWSTPSVSCVHRGALPAGQLSPPVSRRRLIWMLIDDLSKGRLDGEVPPHRHGCPHPSTHPVRSCQRRRVRTRRRHHCAGVDAGTHRGEK
jgi:NADH:ubiquinone oxidoreductase subunit E